MSYTIKDNVPALIIKTKQEATAFLRIAGDELIKISTPKTPRRDNDLRSRVLKGVIGLSARVVWKMPYAAAQEAGQRTVRSSGKVVRFRNYTTPGTGAHFAEDAAKQIPYRTAIIARRAGLI